MLIIINYSFPFSQKQLFLELCYWLIAQFNAASSNSLLFGLRAKEHQTKKHSSKILSYYSGFWAGKYFLLLSYRSSNYYDRDSCCSFSLFKAIAKGKSKLISIDLKSEKWCRNNWKVNNFMGSSTEMESMHKNKAKRLKWQLLLSQNWEAHERIKS